jgi:hypothetical protein
MRISIAYGIVMLLLAMALGTAAVAQYGGGVCATPDGAPMKMWNIRAGAFLPRTDGDFKTTWNVGIEHEHPADRIIKGVPGNFSLSVDYAQFKSFDGVKTRNVGLIPIYVNWKNHYMIANSDQSWYWGVGAGVYAGLGYYFTPAWFGEVRYLASNHISDSRLVALDLGYSF